MQSDYLKELSMTAKYLLAAEYTKRYQEIITQIPSEILYGGPDVPEEIDGVLHAYIDLCAEEYAIRDQVPAEVWDNWSEGIVNGFKKPAVQKVWNSFFKANAYEDLYNYLVAQGVEFEQEDDDDEV